MTIVAASVPNKLQAPTNVPSLTSRTQISVQWQAPPQNVGSLISAYKLHYKTQAQGDFVTSITVDADTFAYTITDGITKGVYYSVAI